MATEILAITETKTSNTKILDKRWAGEFQLLCTTYAADPVKMQIREEDGEWMDAKFNGNQIQLTGKGEVIDVKLARDYDYQLVTANPGARVVIAKHNVHG